MAPLEYAPSLLSTLFRLSAYVFLRVIPGRIIASKILPTLFVLYTTSLWLLSRPTPKPIKLEATNAEDTKPLEKSEELNGSPSPLPAEKKTSPLTTLALSLPTTRKNLRIANISINVLLLALSLEYLANPFLDDASDVVFSRVGAVYHNAAKIVVRYPVGAIPEVSSNTTNPVRVMWREHGKELSLGVDAPWKSGPEVQLDVQQDWTATTKLSGLWPSTEYEYRLTDTDGTFLPYPSSPIQFRTFPDPSLVSGNHFRFIVTSCITTNFPYLPFGGTRIKGFDLLADYLVDEKKKEVPAAPTQETVNATEQNSTAEVVPEDADPSTDFMLFLGDFIYADVPIYSGNDKEAYRKLYRRNYKSKSARRVYEKLPIIHAYDDHEIINNYAGEGMDAEPFPNASDAFDIYNAHANYDPSSKGKNYFDFRHGDSAFFIMDTRRYRTKISKKVGDDIDDLTAGMERTMLGSEQMEAFFNWLQKVNGTAAFKFVVTSVPFTSLWGHDAQTDSWAGYPLEKAVLLDAMQSVPNVILLSGDRHEFAAIEFNGASDNGNTVREFSTSPLSMFYIPFVRTLKTQSDETVPRLVTKEALNATTGEVESVDVIEDIPREKVIKYLPTGNHKWSSFEVDTRDAKKPILRLEVMIDGHKAHQFEMIGSPVQLSRSKAVSAFIEGGINRLMSQFVKPSRWF